MKIVIHVGMPKTGTSSIQRTFARHEFPGLEYLDWEGRPDPALFGLLFEDERRRSELPAFKERGAECLARLPEMHAKAYQDLVRRMSGAGDRTVVLSSELISMPQFCAATRRMRDFFSEWSDDIRVIGYVRPPAGFAASSFQQMLKGGTVPADLFRAVAPHYRARFEQIDNIFGRERVCLKEFARERLRGGDVVQDFAAEIGLAPLSPDQLSRVNESLSLEGVALLYVQRTMGRGFVSGFSNAFRANTRFIARLATIGSRKFAFSPQMLAPILEKERDDIAWMEERLGHPFSESLTPHPDAIDSLDDLVDIALEQFDAVQALLGEIAIEGPATVDNLVRALERLREDCYAPFAPSPARGGGHASGEPDSKLRQALARLLWLNEGKARGIDDPVTRKAAWDADRAEYVEKAADFLVRLQRNGLKLAEVSEPAQGG